MALQDDADMDQIASNMLHEAGEDFNYYDPFVDSDHESSPSIDERTDNEKPPVSIRAEESMQEQKGLPPRLRRATSGSQALRPE